MTMVLIVLIASVFVKLSSETHTDHGSTDWGPDQDTRHELFRDIKRLISSADTTPEEAIRDVISVVLSRLNLHEPVAHDIIECFNRQEKNISDILTEQRFFMFCDNLLNAALYSINGPPESRCFIQHWHNSHQPWQNVTSLMLRLKEVYVRDAPLKLASHTSSMRYVVEGYANRLLCVNVNTINTILRHPSSHIPKHSRQILSTAIVHFILRGISRKWKIMFDTIPVARINTSVGTVYESLLCGYNFIHDEVCPIDFIRDIYSRYTDSSRSFTERNLLELLSDMQNGVSNHPPHSDHSDHSEHPQQRSEHELELGQHYQQHPPPSHHEAPANGGNMLASRQNNDHHFQNNFMSNNVDHYRVSFFNPSLYGTRVSSQDFSKIDKCFSPSELLSVFTKRHIQEHERSADGGGWSHHSIDWILFQDMCPAILHQLLDCSSDTQVTSTATSVKFSDRNSTNTTFGDIVVTENISALKRYLYGSLAVLLISLCSLFGAVFMKLSRADVKAYLMGCMMSLAVGCLVADAVLHLLPEIIYCDTEDTEDHKLIPDHLQKLCALLGSVYAFFVLELILSRQNTHSHSHGPDTVDTQEIQLKYVKPLKTTNVNLTLNNQLRQTNSGSSAKSSNPPNEGHVDNNFYEANNLNRTKHEDIEELHDLRRVVSNISDSSERHSNHGDVKDLKALAWMIIIGDGIHNFADGLALGAAFSLSFTKGLSTSITVLCHEVPHELGDFAVLVSTGMSIKRAMLLNFLSSLTAFAGLYTGLALGAQVEATKWIFSVGAGMFLYVALTDLIPECKEYFKRTPTLKMFLGENIGLLFGYVAMLLLALYEDKLEIKT